MAVKQLGGLQRGLDVLEAIAFSQPLSGSAVADEVALDRSAVQRVLVTLEAGGWIRQQPGSKAWEVGGRTARLASAIAVAEGLGARARPHLEALRDELGETAFLAVARRDRATVAEVAQSEELVRIAPSVGMTITADLSAAVLAIAAFLDPPEAAALLGSREHDDRLAAELRRTARRGYAVNRDAVHVGATSIAAPVRDGRGLPVGAVVVTIPTVRAVRIDLDRVASLVIDAANACGHGAPPRRAAQ